MEVVLLYSFEQQINFTGGTVNPQAGQKVFGFSDFTNANSSGLIDEWLISPQIPTITTGDSLIFMLVQLAVYMQIH
ncbi:MAG: hypothetical protein MZV64_57370 [Ignavibacteriales bacterium]|nr:hypothetical protein [Ignavibacteriales bacterium]